MKRKLFITTTIPVSLNFFKGNLSFLNKTYDVCAISSQNVVLKEIGLREGIRTYHIPMKRAISLFCDIYSFLKFLWLFFIKCPDIVHGNTPKASFLSMLAAKITRVKVRIYMCHGLRYQGASGIMKWLLMKMEKITCICANEVICVSEGVKNTLIKDGICNKSKAVVVNYGSPSGIDVDKFNRKGKEFHRQEIRNTFGINENDFVFIFIGRIVGDKGVNELLSAFERLLIVNKKSHLIIVGSEDKGLDPISERSSQVINNKKNIHFVGKQNDIRSFLNASDALVLPSYREGFGMVLIEAGAMGLPCITTDISGCNEIIVEKENGVIIPPKDENKLHEAMQYFLDNPEDVERMANNSRKMIIDRYEQQVVWDALLEEYRRLEKELIKS